MSSISSVRTLASTGPTAFALLIATSRSCSCSTLTSFAPGNNRFEEVTVIVVHSGKCGVEQIGQAHKSLLVQVWRLRDLGAGAVGQQHPDRDLETSPDRI
jgi:hypothetical protein